MLTCAPCRVAPLTQVGLSYNKAIMLFTRFPEEVSREMVKFCEDRLTSASRSAADAISASLDESNGQGSRKRAAPRRRVSAGPNQLGSAADNAGPGAANGMVEDVQVEEDDDDDDVEDTNAQVPLMHECVYLCLCVGVAAAALSVRFRLFTLKSVGGVYLCRVAFAGTRWVAFQVHLADLELDFSDVRFDRKGRAVQSDYFIIVRVFLVFAVPLLASMVRAVCACAAVVWSGRSG